MSHRIVTSITAFGLSLVVTLGMLGAVDHLSTVPVHQELLARGATIEKAPRPA